VKCKKGKRKEKGKEMNSTSTFASSCRFGPTKDEMTKD
jgi:hypothetical protein